MAIHSKTSRSDRVLTRNDHKPTTVEPETRLALLAGFSYHPRFRKGNKPQSWAAWIRGEGMRHVRFPVAAIIVAVLAAPSFARPAVPFADAGIHAIQFIDQSEGWAVGDDGVIWHSMDGGKAWERQKSGTRASLRGVHVQTPYTGWAVGRLETTNGGASVGVMLKTTDGGIKWEEMGVNVLPGLHCVRFFDEKAGIVCGDGSGAFPSGMFTTGDGGRTWRPVPGVKLVSCRAADFFPGVRDGVIAGAWSRLGSISNDGVYRESELDPLAGRTLHAVCASNTQQKGFPPAFAAGDGGAVLTSTNGGKSWGFVNLGLPPEALAACDFRCCAPFRPHVWVAGKRAGSSCTVPTAARRGKCRRRNCRCR